MMEINFYSLKSTQFTLQEEKKKFIYLRIKYVLLQYDKSDLVEIVRYNL